MKNTCVEDFKKITELYDENLNIEEVCTHIEKMAKTDDAQKVIREVFKPIKEEYLRKEKQFGEALNTVQDEVVKLGAQAKEQMGSANAEMLGDIVQKMNSRLEGVTKQSRKAKILAEGIAEMQQVVEDAEKQAGKGELGKVANVLKSALNIVDRLGSDKTAKPEFAAVKVYEFLDTLPKKGNAMQVAKATKK